ncbi:hypothetical protein [Arthrobacter koreensis]|uniref:hypothetical protein n=1 Tax=Arthrobacter koreensis TaxID=199136 RepID=UPI003C6C96FC
MLSRGAGSRVNLASQAGVRGSVGGAAYTAAKHALTRAGEWRSPPVRPPAVDCAESRSGRWAPSQPSSKGVSAGIT